MKVSDVMSKRPPSGVRRQLTGAFFLFHPATGIQRESFGKTRKCLPFQRVAMTANMVKHRITIANARTPDAFLVPNQSLPADLDNS